MDILSCLSRYFSSFFGSCHQKTQEAGTEQAFFVQESDLVPYSASAIPEGPYLIFAPHPDDESIGMGGTILLATSIGIDVHLVIVTDGSLGGQSDVRKQEAQYAANLLGIKTIDFLDIKDRAVGREGLKETDIRRLLELYAPKTVFIPAFLEFHPDHRATTASALCHLTALNYSSNLWLYEISRQGEVNRLIDISDVSEQKRQAIRCYKSQLSQAAYEDVAFAINKSRAYTLGKVVFAEGFWAISGTDELKVLKTSWQNRLGLYWHGLSGEQEK